MANQQTNQQLLASMIEQQRLSHAYLFLGEEGTGRRQTAEWLACAILCPHQHHGEPCLTCSTCQRVMKHEHPDVWWLQPEGKNIRTQQITDLKKELSMSGMEGMRQVFIIERADTMTESAANQLLKFIEEPTSPFVAVLMATNRQQLLPTIISRCQSLYFSRQPRTQFQEQLEKAGIEASLVPVLSYLTSQVSEAEALSQDDLFLSLWKSVQEWYSLLVERQPMSFVYVQAQLMPHVKGRAKTMDAVRQQQQVLDLIMILARRDFVATEATIYRYLLELVEEARTKSKANVNFQHILEQIAYKMMKGGG